jgi:hypothetical protein
MSLPGSFVTTALAQLDDSLTSTMLNFTSQDCDADDTLVHRAYCMSVENSNADGIDTVLNHGNESRSSSFNVLSPTLLPIGIMTVETIQGHKVERPLKVLFDSGSMVTLIHLRVLLEDMEAHVLSRPVSLYTVGGKVALERGVTLQTIRFPELSPTRSYVNEVEAVMCQETRDYDVILGIDVMVPAGLDVHPSTQSIKWGELSVPWRARESMIGQRYVQTLKKDKERRVPELESESFMTKPGSSEILASKYEEVDTNFTAQQQDHCSQRQRDQLAEVLRRYTTLFSGKLGCFSRKVHLEYDQSAPPFHSRPYPIPHAHRQVFLDELERVVELGVLSKTGPAKFLSPTFIIPKKDGRVRFVSDFRKLNKIIRRKVYHLPIIHDILRKRSGYKYFTKLDISMQY